MKGLTDKVAVVTGAAQGIGRAIALRLADEGCDVAVLDLNRSAAEETAYAVTERGRKSIAFAADVSDAAGHPALVAQIEEALGKIAILVNAAGICPTHPFDQVTADVFRKVLDINVVGPTALLQAVVPSMKQLGGGAVINLASISAFLPKLEQLEYGASKAAIVSVTRSSALSLAPFGIRVNAIAPGVIDTPLTGSIADMRSKIRGVDPAETLAPTLKATPISRMGAPEEIAAMAAFLASDESSYVTGQTFDVCGGFLMR